MEYIFLFNFLCSKPNVVKADCLKKYEACVEAVAATPAMKGETKEDIAMIISQDGGTRKRLCK